MISLLKNTLLIASLGLTQHTEHKKNDAPSQIVSPILIDYAQRPLSEQEQTILKKNGFRSWSENEINHHSCYEKEKPVCVRAVCTVRQGYVFKREVIGLAILNKHCPKTTESRFFTNNNTQKSPLYIQYLCVDPKKQNSGVGTFILKSIVQHFEPSYVLLSALPSSVKFYEKFGFKKDGHFYMKYQCAD